MIQKIIRLSDFPLLNKLLTKGKTVLAHNKKNYYIELDQIKGDQIIHSEEIEADRNSNNRKNVIKLDFDTNKSKYFTVYNGEDGDKGNKGEIGEKGYKGNSFDKRTMLNRAEDALTIVNDDETNDSTAVWSAYRGKLMEDFLRSIAEKIITDEEYQLMFNEEFDEDGRPNDIHQVFIDLEFVTQNNNQSTALVHHDTKSYKTYVKYWTYEDEGEETYYIQLSNGTYQEVLNFNIWDDLYLNPDNDETYYTRKLVITETDPITGEVVSSEYQYTPIIKPIWIDLEFTSTKEDQQSIIVSNLEGDDDPSDISKETKEEEIIILHRPITSISIDGNDHITIPINSIFTKAINIQPIDYLNSPICIEYDETKIEVFEDGRIMALENNCDTIIKIYSQENPEIYANIYVNVITYVDSIQFNTPSIKAFAGYTTTIDYTVLPETASNKKIKWSSNNKDVAIVDKTGKITLKNAGTTTIYAKAMDGSGKVSRIDIIVDTAISDIIFDGINSNITYTKEEVIAFNNNLPGALHYGDIKPAVEAVEGQDEVLYTSEEIKTHNAELDIWEEGKIKIEATTGQDEVLYTSEEIEDHNYELDIWEEGKIKIHGVNPVEAEDEREYTDEEVDAYNETLYGSIHVGETKYIKDILVGIPTQIPVTVLPENASNKHLVWESDNNNINAGASEDGINGRIYITNKDNATIRIYPEDGSDVVKYLNIIGKMPVRNITLDKVNATIDLGDTLQLNATITENADNRDIIWTSSNTDLATVTDSGLVRSIAGGDVIITATAADGSGVKASCDITCVVLITDITFNEKTIELHVGSTYAFRRGDISEGGNYQIAPTTANVTQLNWYTSDNEIASINNNGEITAHKEGKIKVYAAATDNSGVIASADVIVTVPSSQLLLSDYNLTLNVDQSYTLIATVTPDNTSLQNVEFTSSDPDIVTIDANGNITAIRRGETSIFVRTLDTNISDKCDITVL